MAEKSEPKLAYRITEEFLTIDGDGNETVINTVPHYFPCKNYAEVVEAQFAYNLGPTLQALHGCKRRNQEPDVGWMLDALQAAIK